ncbi:DUF2157 domain-containing protein [Stappia sp. F7233]|uniref:DUF2157 domain-containing protein n=1 Tax=Stappia albiluteola TaxID=2758565 RepID=A0A839AH11_9HYPH|nr:DUF2157 domain-containing protein [Stappia albiluteola]MBA5778192.1 DUF2157 domain-containing protein [Stappia albiluteola]
MFDASYRRRIEQDLESWVGKGWISSDNAGRIIADVRARTQQKARFPAILATVGVLCLALAVAAFVAANWDAIPRAAKLIGILAAIAGANGLAAFAWSRGRTFIADLATLFAVLVFIAGLALVGQIYHLPQDWPAGAALAALGALAAAWLTGSRGAAIAAAAASISYVLARGDPAGFAPLPSFFSLALLAAIAVHTILHPSRLGRWVTLLLVYAIYLRLVAEAGYGELIFNEGLLVAVAALGTAMTGLGLWLAAKGEGALPTRLPRDGILLFAHSLIDAGATALIGTVTINLIAVTLDGDDKGVAGAVLALWPVSVMILLAAGLLFAAISNAANRNGVLFVAGAAVLSLAAPILSDFLAEAVILHAAVALAAVIAVSSAGAYAGLSYWTLAGHIGTAVVALWLLNETIGSLIGQSLFFLVAGLVLIAVAFWSARRMRSTRGEGG